MSPEETLALQVWDYITVQQNLRRASGNPMPRQSTSLEPSYGWGSAAGAIHPDSGTGSGMGLWENQGSYFGGCCGYGEASSSGHGTSGGSGHGAGSAHGYGSIYGSWTYHPKPTTP